MPQSVGFQYLNVANQWPSFQLHQLTIGPDGALRLAVSNQQYASYGAALGGPFSTALNTTEWFRLHVTSAEAPEDTHIQMFTLTNDGGNPPFVPNSPNPFAGNAWSSIPRDLLDGVIPNPPAPSLWIGLLVQGTPWVTPEIAQIRVDYGRDTYLPFLPGLYSQDTQARDFLERLLALSASALGGTEDEIEDLPLLFDAQASPAPDWLAWLAGWLDFRVSGRWTDTEARSYLAQAFELYGWRGTIEGLRRMLKMYAGVNARIWEPARYTSLWSLGEVSSLGFTTMLSPSPLEGAVLGSTASLDLSRVTDDDTGAMLFEDLAHTFCVEVYGSELKQGGALQSVRALLDREKPAHTVYGLSVIEPGMNVGWQARIGVDSILGNGFPPLRLGQTLGAKSLAAAAAPCTTEVV
jgi:phage tail-like protein